MDYKKIIRNRALRNKILELLSFLPDKLMIELQYFIKFGRRINFKKPQRFTEKLQLYKLYYRNPLMPICVDKIEVRKYINDLGLANILVPIIGAYDDPSSIDWNSLPDKFVIKDSQGGGGNSVIICKDKKNTNINSIILQVTEWINRKSIKTGGREWVYGRYPHRIIIEQLLEAETSLIDYKFFVFNGSVSMCYVITDRKMGVSAKLGIFTPEMKRIQAYRYDEEPLDFDISKPDKWNEMIKIAEQIAKPFPEARIDLYCVNSNIYFGEITFFDGSGYQRFVPDSFDFECGQLFDISSFYTHKD